MKTPVTLLLGLVLLLGNLMQAQTPPSTTPPPDAPPTQGQGQPPREHPHFFEQLNLTDQQKAAIKQIRQTVTDKKEAHQQILALLTPEQKAQLKQLMEQWKQTHPNWHGPEQGQGNPPGQTSMPAPAPAPSANGNTPPEKVHPLNI